MSDEEIINEAKKIIKLTPAQGRFLLDWCSDVKDQEFGFKEVRGFQEQIKMAIDFYLKTEREWQTNTLNNWTRATFPKFFLISAQLDGVDLSQNFIKKLQGGENVILGSSDSGTEQETER